MKELTCVTLRKYSDNIFVCLEFGADNVRILKLHQGQDYLSVIAGLNALEREIREIPTEAIP